LAVTKTDTVVIGSGISGLTVAALLARQGREVVIVERQRRPGGALRRFSRAGVPFDIGFHYTSGLAPGQVLRALWNYLGLSSKLTTVPLHPDGCDLFRIRGFEPEVRAFYSYDLLQEELCTIFPRQTAGIKRYLAMVREACQAVPFYDLDLPLTPFLRGASTASKKSLAAVMAELIDDPALQAILLAPILLYGVTPQQAGLTMHAVVAHGYYSGAWGIDGGGQAVIDALLDILARDGVTVLTGEPAVNITVADNRVTGLSTGRREIAAANIIYTGHPRYLADLLPDAVLRPSYRSRLRELEDTISMFTVFGETNAPAETPLLDLANLYRLEPGMTFCEAPAAANPDRLSFMLTAPGRRDGLDSPAARGVILMRPSSMAEVARFDLGRKSRGAGYEEWKMREADRLLACAAATFGEACSRIRPLATGTPLTCRDELGGPDGGIYGVQHNRHQHPAAARTKLPGLYLSGQSSLMTGLMGASMAALVTAGEILNLEKIWDLVRACR
jgi:all-trans-retinol 13,14-reductase